MTDTKSILILKMAYLMVVTAFLLYFSLISSTYYQRTVNFIVSLSLWLVGFIFGASIGIYRRVMRK